MKWSDVPPEDFELCGYGTPECCWVKPDLRGEDEPTLGELSRHVYSDGLGNFGVLLETIIGVIDVDGEPVERRYCRIPPPPEHGWSDVPPEITGWYWVRTDTGDIDPVSVYLAPDEETLVFSGIGWPSFSPVTSPNLSWVEIPRP